MTGEPCVVFHCQSPGEHDLLLGRQYLGRVCFMHGSRIGHGEIEHRDQSTLQLRHDVYVIDAEKADGWRLVVPLGRPNEWTIYAPEHTREMPTRTGHHVQFDEDTGRIEVQ